MRKSGLCVSTTRTGKALHLLQAVLLALASSLFMLGCGDTLSPSKTSSPMIYPQDGAKNVDPLQPFQWVENPQAIAYSLLVGTKRGAWDVYFESNLRHWATSRTVWGLSPGNKYYAIFSVQTAAGWTQYPFTFATGQSSTPGPTNAAALHSLVENLTGQIRLSTQGRSNYPTRGTPLYEDISAFSETGADCSNFANTLVRLLAQNGVYSRRVSLVIVDWITHVLVEYYDPFLQKWSVADPTFGAVYFDDASQTGQSAAELSQDIVAENFSLIKAKFVTQYKSFYMNVYMLDPVTNFLNVVPQGVPDPDAAVNSPYQYLVPTTPGKYGCYEFRGPDGNGTLTLQDPPTGQWQVGAIILKPWDSRGWFPTVCLNDGWSITSQPSGTALYAFRRVLF